MFGDRTDSFCAGNPNDLYDSFFLAYDNLINNRSQISLSRHEFAFWWSEKIPTGTDAAAGWRKMENEKKVPNALRTDAIKAAPKIRVRRITSATV